MRQSTRCIQRSDNLSFTSFFSLYLFCAGPFEELSSMSCNHGSQSKSGVLVWRCTDEHHGTDCVYKPLHSMSILIRLKVAALTLENWFFFFIYFFFGCEPHWLEMLLKAEETVKSSILFPSTVTSPTEGSWVALTSLGRCAHCINNPMWWKHGVAAPLHPALEWETPFHPDETKCRVGWSQFLAF